MPYKVYYGSIPIECETADDAIDIARRLGHSGKAPRLDVPMVNPADIVAEGELDRALLQRFFAALSDHQKRLVLMIGTHPKGISAAQLNKALGFDGNVKLGAHLSNISRNAQKFHLVLPDLWTRRVQVSGGKKGDLEFHPTVSFALAAREMWGEKTLPNKTA